MSIRACFACKERKEKEDLLNFKLISKDFLREGEISLPETFLNIFKDVSNILFLDLYSKLPGKGINICPKKECIKAALKKIYKGKNIDVNSFINYLLETIEKELITNLVRAKKASLIDIGLDNIDYKDKDAFIIVSQKASLKAQEKLKNFYKNLLVLDEEDLSSFVGLENKNIKYLLIKNTPLGKKIFRLLKLYKSLKNAI